MNEQLARDVVLVKAIETTDQKREILSDDDRRYANRTARELAQWQASETKSAATPDHFLQQRSEQIIKKLAQRHPAFATFARRRTGLHAVAWLLPLLAFVLGAGLDRITDPHRVDLLSAPLLAIVAWNLLVYVVMLIWLCVPKAGLTRVRAGWIHRLSVGPATLPRKMPHALSAALFAFMAEWSQLSARLNGARLARTIHLSAALFALGALASLYARGIMAQYGAGWESTFLDANQVHQVLSLLFWPALTLFPLQGFTLPDVQALHFASGAAGAAGAAGTAAAGARWVHLYAATLLLLVVLPRLIFACSAALRAGWLARRFPLDVTQPYFRQLTDVAGGEPGVLRVLPYSFTLDEARARALETVAVNLLGERAKVRLAPSAAYGEDAAAIAVDLPVTLTAVLFNLAATPEKENHGAFLAAVMRAIRPATVLLDDSAFRARTPDPQRVRERIELWREFCIFHGAEPTVVDLLAPAGEAP